MEAAITVHLTPEQQALDENTPQKQLWELALEGVELARLVARNSSADQELLQILAATDDALIREGVATNPNTPTTTLLKLGAEFPSQLLENPVFSLLILENPKFIEEIPVATLRSLASQPNVPMLLLAEIALRLSDRILLMKLANNAQASRDVLRKLMECRYSEVIEAAELHINWIGEPIEEWSERATRYFNRIVLPFMPRGYPSIYAEVGIIPKVIVQAWYDQVYHKTAADNSTARGTDSTATKRNALLAAAESIHSSPEILEIFVKSQVSELRLRVAGNLATPEYLLDELAEDKNRAYWGSVAQAIAANPNATASMFKKLMKLNRKELLCDIANHPNTSEEAFEVLFRKQEYEVLKILAEGQRTPLYLLEKILETKIPNLCEAIAKNSNTAANLIERLAAENVQAFCHLSLQNSNLNDALFKKWLETCINRKDFDALERESQNPYAPICFLEQLLALAQTSAYDKSLWRLIRIRMALARNPNLPEHIAEQLADDPGDQQFNVRLELAQNPNLPKSAWSKLSQNADESIQFYLARNPCTPSFARLEKEVFEQKLLHDRRLIFVAQNIHTSSEILAFLATLNSWQIRIAVAQNSNAPAPILRTLALEQDDGIRTGVACNPSTPPEILAQLARDKNLSVRQAVAQNSNTTANVLPIFLEKDDPASYLIAKPRGLPDVLEHYARNDALLSRIIILSHPQTPVQILANSFSSTLWQERYCIATNPSTPSFVIEQLKQDANSLVRSAAASHLT